MSSSPFIYRSNAPSVELQTSSIFTFIFSNTRKSLDDSPAYIDAPSGAAITRAQHHDLSLRLGYAVKNKGAKRGDVAMIFSPNSIAWPPTVFGLIAAGVRVTLANSSYTPPELAHQIKDSRAGLIFVHPSLFSTLSQALSLLHVSEADARKRVVIMSYVDQDQVDEKTANIDGKWTRLRELFKKGKLNKEEKFIGKQTDETALLCYSSGTTGLSKGVESTHRNILTVLQIYPPLYPKFDPYKDVTGAVLPFYHIFAIKVLFLSFLFGTPTVVLPRFEPILFCQSVERYRISLLNLVPPILVVLANHPAVDQYDLRSLRFLMSGAAPLGTGLVKKVKQRFTSKGVDLIITQGYGLTETSPTTHFLPAEDAERKIGSTGILLPNLEARLVDDDDKDVEPGPESRGEIWIRGPSVMKGYLNNPTATKNSITPDGWFKTGDVAVRDEEGYYTVVDRKKELIKYKGFQVPPADLEAVLLTKDDIQDAGVIGVDSPEEATELPRAYVVSTRNAELLKKPEARKAFENEVQNWITTKVAKHKYLRGGVVVVEAIPKSAAGKILRRQLRDLAKKEAQEELTSRLKARL